MKSIGAIITFMIIMWGMIILTGGIAVIAVNSISVIGYGDIGNVATIAAKTIVILGIIITWVFVLLKLKNIVFKKQIFR